jgi:hypothetical protein
MTVSTSKCCLDHPDEKKEEKEEFDFEQTGILIMVFAQF